MTRILQSFAEVSADYDLALVDLWGCVHNGEAIYPAAEAALIAFRKARKRVILVTNAPRPEAGVRARLDEMGLSHDAYDAIATSGDAAQQAMLMGAVGTKVWHLGPDKDDGFFTDLPDWASDRPAIERVSYDEAEGIVCTGPFEELTETPEDYRGRFLAAKARGLKLLCANPDIVVDYGDTRIYCAGALAQLYDRMGGESLYFGKPHPPIYDLARRHALKLGLTFAEDRVIAIGDGIQTDVKGGVAEGVDTLFITGGLAAEEFGADVEQPEQSPLDAWLQSEEQSPTFAIGRLR
ncbi:TIGR01459 family HAD-type hydrolase [Roseibaca sp. V10]|uniref:TIGR01459 family HAD-type hydrolase n=1 Tax=Roseinatronobacter domitianus TaxID=2940293 RepID=A0ABT0M1P1_9RHOB|nr:TIGR01459 family HAD-type hydrolase [Roseibaca domitiana]MCL1628775.1 TIGR01459 family HAD-type hydrolase [Roseibaca domitiana]